MNQSIFHMLFWFKLETVWPMVYRYSMLQVFFSRALDEELIERKWRVLLKVKHTTIPQQKELFKKYNFILLKIPLYDRVLHT